MSIERFFTTAVTILTPGSLETRYGNEAPDWATASSVDTFGWLTQMGSTEEIGLRDAVESRWRLFLPPGTVIGAADRVVAEGKTFAVDGDPQIGSRPSGEHHVEASLIYVAEVEAEVGS